MTNPKKANWEVVNFENNIVFIRDLNQGNISVTNDAEAVLWEVRNRYGHRCRLVYQDTQGEWSEILQAPDHNHPGTWRIAFRPWNGLVWDIITK